MGLSFQKATKKQSKARIALDGPSGSGKTWTMLVTATALADGGKIAIIDSENGSASKYASDFDFDVLELDGDFHPDRYVEALNLAAKMGYSVAGVDSLSHAWAGRNGVLEQVDAAKARFGGNSQRAWAVGTPMWQSIIDAMLQSPIHVIVTMRSKQKLVEVEKGGGKKGYEKMGMEPVARDGIDYEFDVVGDLDIDHNLVVSKSRAGVSLDSIYRRPGPEFGEAILAWLNDGAPDLTALARELTDGLDDAGKAALKDGLAKAKIGLDDLADEKVLSKARSIANKIRSDAVAAASEADGVAASSAGGVEQGAPNTADAPRSPATRREPDDPMPEEPKARKSPVGQASLGSDL